MLKQSINAFLEASGRGSVLHLDDVELASALDIMTREIMSPARRFWYVYFLGIQGGSQAYGAAIIDTHPLRWAKEVSGGIIAKPGGFSMVMINFFHEVSKEEAVIFGWKDNSTEGKQDASENTK